MSASITLNCLVYGQRYDRIFSVETPGNGNVITLKKAIKNKKNLTFQDVEADTLKLWNVSIPIDEFLEENINDLELGTMTPLLPVKRLSAVFSGKFEDDHLHIVVQGPAAIVQTNGSPRLQLNCFALGGNRNNVFSVKIPGTESVSTLKEEIKDKMRPAFDHIVADTLILWRVSVPDTSDLELKLNGFDLADEDQLSPMQVLSSVFSDPPLPGQVHIVVKPPSAHLLFQQQRASKSDTNEPWTNIGQLETTQALVVNDAVGVPPPSSIATFPRFHAEQKRHPIWNGRPSVNSGIPIQLYHPAFANFLRISREGTVDIDVKPESYSATHSLFHAAADLHDNDAERVTATWTSLGLAIENPLPPLDHHGMHFNGAITEVCGGVPALVALKEDKNEIGTDGCDPSHQCAFGFRSYYASERMERIRKSCCCPTFLIALAGPWMCIFGAVFVENAVVQQLTDFIWIGGHPYDDRKIESVTRILASLGTGIKKLKDFYKTLSQDGLRPNPQRFFPFIRRYPVKEDFVNFSYNAYLFPVTQDTRDTPRSPSKAIFVATTEVKRRRIIVKFTQRYNAKAHRLLAIKGCAPELLYCSKEDPNSVDFAGLIMIVMEYIDGRTAYQRYSNGRLDQRIFDQVEKALGILHDGNIVFGDLRYPNIIITKDERVLLLDFDWCGEHEKDTYPVSLNDNHDPLNNINWHPDVKRGGKMAKVHDTFMLDGMRPQSDTTSLHNQPPGTTSSQDREHIRLGKRKARAQDDEVNEGEGV
ncbi:hypothetical protein H4582DRAFT_2075187 [Lactarius indigo]|nr:hypothetical protein H4582DRAFT_2075187 [Lactarius indigo]